MNSNSSNKNAQSLHANSQKFQKASTTKQYQTFSKDEQKIFLSDLKKQLALHFGVAMVEANFTAEALLGYVEEIDLGVYNKILTKILAKHNPSIVADTKTLTQWRKKIKGWIKSEEKPERRGGLVVPPEYSEIFINEIRCILRSMPYRCFKLLKNNVLEVLEAIHNKIHTGPNTKPFDSKTCSKHWWHDFVHRNEDIKQLWESLLLKRTVEANNTSPKKHAKKANKNVNKELESDQNTLASPGQYSEFTFVDYQSNVNSIYSEGLVSPQRGSEMDFFGVASEPMFNQEEEKQAREETFTLEQPSSPSHYISYGQDDNTEVESDFGMTGNYGYEDESSRFCIRFAHEVSRTEEQVGDFGFGTNFNWNFN